MHCHIETPKINSASFWFWTLCNKIHAVVGDENLVILIHQDDFFLLEWTRLMIDIPSTCLQSDDEPSSTDLSSKNVQEMDGKWLPFSKKLNMLDEKKGTAFDLRPFSVSSCFRLPPESTPSCCLLLATLSNHGMVCGKDGDMSCGILVV
mmetsp:Transcript_40591/g.84495  ORF Transcript_40591/g.84495 Transcript_40591/m.84495 type:complete len:149 (-) Transcript_40591:22-468(-)